MKSLQDAIFFIKCSKTYCTDAVIDGMILLACEMFNIEREQIINMINT